MHPATTFAIRLAGDADEAVLRRLAALDDAPPLEHPVLIGEIDGRPAAAVALEDRRIVADPFAHTAYLRAQLRIRAGAFDAYARMPDLGDRLRAALALQQPRMA